MALNETGPPHGFELPPEDDRLLRAPPPDDALRWCAAAIEDFLAHAIGRCA